MEIQKYFSQKKELYNVISLFIENDESDEAAFNDLAKIIKDQEILNSKDEFTHFLRIISNLSNNYHKAPHFFDKIKQIFIYYQNQIKKTFSNLDLFNIFEGNKLIILILIENKILKINSNLIDNFLHKNEYCHFFIPEIKEFYSKENKEINQDILNIDSDLLQNYEEKRQNGQNHSYICGLIRTDSVEDFISYIHKQCISINSKINHSIFETNLFLNEHDPTLIEYAAFYGSIQIFNYLRMSNAELTSSLWLYVIHSNNAEMIHLLEELNVELDDTTFEMYLIESIKCHHNDIANYILNEKMNSEVTENVYGCAFDYYNYNFLPEDLTKSFVFFYIYNYNYTKMISVFLKMKEEEIESFIISKSIYFFK